MTEALDLFAPEGYAVGSVIDGRFGCVVADKSEKGLNGDSHPGVLSPAARGVLRAVLARLNSVRGGSS